MRYLLSITIFFSLHLCCQAVSSGGIYFNADQDSSQLARGFGDGIVYPIIYRESRYRPLLALKSNLLFDMLSLINIELEIPIKRQWSITAEIISPWWRWDNGELDSKRHRIQIINGNIEGRYWWGDRESRPILTGWFTGLYAGGGLYDFEHKHKGYQGEFFIAAGVSGGYAHTINRSQTLRMEYSIGIGYLKTHYRYYEANCYFDGRWHPVKQRDGDYRWFGPTRAKVSLSWLINYRKRW